MGLEERSGMAKVLVGEPKGDTFAYSWFKFEGEKASSYEDQGKVYTLYKHTAPGYTSEAYRVHVSDETISKEPTYKLHPGPEDKSPYTRRDVAAEYPRFIKDMDSVDVHSLD
jgi:hypothetical protein